MLKITILEIGKTKTRFLAEGESEFQKRLQSFCQLDIKVLKDVKSVEAAAQIKLECRAILEQLPRNSFVIALDERGKQFNSGEFAQKLEDLATQGHSHLLFIIGGPYGLCQEVVDRADLRLSCSQFTFTHEMVRLILLEQIYRAFTINSGKKYHH